MVFLELDIWLRRVRDTPRKILKYNKANWDQIKLDLDSIFKTMNEKMIGSSCNDLWDYFKTHITSSIDTNIPSKMLTYKHKLPWVRNSLSRFIKKKNKLYKKGQTCPQKYKEIKQTIQREIRKSYWNYIEKIICDLPIDEPYQPGTSKASPKQFYSYIKSMRSEKVGIPPLKHEGDWNWSYYGYNWS